MTLKFHFLNVGHGNATIVELVTSNQKKFGLIDTCAANNAAPRALTKLQELGANELAFFAISHPHADHYTGIGPILDAYKDKIGACFLFPLLEVLRNDDRRRKMAKMILDVKGKLDAGSSLRGAMKELLVLIMWVDQHQELVQFCSGDKFEVTAPGFGAVEMHSLLPPGRVKGSFFNMLEAGNVDSIGGFMPNEVSTALSFQYKGKLIVLGGDGTKSNWAYRSRYEKNKGEPIDADAICLPHHGSGNDCTPDVLAQLFPEEFLDKDRVAISSGDGRMHPGSEVIKWLVDRKIAPYCTNLIPSCGANVSRLENIGGVDAELGRWVQEVSIDAHFVQPCQGDITVAIDDVGNLSTSNQTGNLCIYRPEFGDLFV